MMIQLTSPTFADLLPGDVVTSKHGAKEIVLSVKQVDDQVIVMSELIRFGGRINAKKTAELLATGQYGSRVRTETYYATRGVWKVQRKAS